MGILEVLKSIMVETKKLDIKKLPSQGLFYQDGFSIKIKKALIEDIIEYEYKFDKHNLLLAIECIKEVVSKNVILSNDWTYNDIKSIDIIFIFLEIVKFTTDKEIKISYINKFGKEDFVSFDTDHFNYFDFSDILDNYDSSTKEFLLDGYRFSVPCIGVETSLTRYISKRGSTQKEATKLNEYSYDFMFFLGNKSNLNFEEIDNLVSIFNDDLDDEELHKIKKIVDRFKGIIAYTLLIDGNSIEIKTKIDLSAIWKI
jgi:hypothetical protein